MGIYIAAVRRISWRRPIAALAGMVAFPISGAMAALPLTQRPLECYRTFANISDSVFGMLRRRYGTPLPRERLDREINTEVDSLLFTGAELRSGASSLGERRAAVEEARRALREASDLHSAKLVELGRRSAELDRASEEYRAGLARLEQRIAAVLNFPNVYQTGPMEFVCMTSPETPEQCIAPTQAIGELNRVLTSVQGIRRQLPSDSFRLADYRDELHGEEGVLATSARDLDIRESNLFGEESNYLNSCAQAVDRARAFQEVVVTRAGSGSPTPSDHFEKLARSVRDAALVALFAGSGGSTTALTGAIAISNFVEDAVDDRTKEIVDNTYLLGDYAVALRRLKSQGSLHPGQEGYDALLRMTRRLGEEMPSSDTAFTFQAISRAPALQAYITAFATEYVTDAISESYSGELERAFGLEKVGPAGRQLFARSALRRGVTAGTSVLVDEFAASAGRIASKQQREVAEYDRETATYR